MEEIKNYNSVVVDLSANANSESSVTKTATYEQAFLGEDFSDAKGKFRAKRKAKKLTKIADRQEVKQARKGGRQEARIARRTTRKTGRQDIRSSQQGARQMRKSTRSEGKQSRKLAAEPEYQEEEVDTTTIDPTVSPEMATDNGYENEDTDNGYESEDNGYESEDSDNSDVYDSEDQDYSEEEDMPSDEMSEEDIFAGEESNFVSEITGDSKASPMVDTICMKIEWNNEMISRLMAAKNKMEANGQDTAKVTDALKQKFDRVQNLEGKLESFAGANGVIDKSKDKQIRQSRTRAREMRMQNVIPPVLISNMAKKGYSKSQIKNWWETKGKSKFSTSSFNGDSNNDVEEKLDTKYWEAPAYDNNEAEQVSVDLIADGDSKSNFGGNSGTYNWKPLLIGAVIGFVAIYAIRKYKLLK